MTVKEDVVCIWNITQPLKKKWNNAICSNMDGPKNYHTKCSKPAKGKQISYDIAYVWNLKKNDTNELMYKTEMDPQT